MVEWMGRNLTFSLVFMKFLAMRNITLYSVCQLVCENSNDLSGEKEAQKRIRIECYLLGQSQQPA